MKEQELARIGRPGIGGEYLALEAAPFHRYVLLRRKRINHHRSEPRQFAVADLPASAMIHELLEAIEAIVEAETERGTPGYLDLDDHGLAGDRPSLRERFEKLSRAASREPLRETLTGFVR